MRKLILFLFIFVLSGCNNVTENESRWESYDLISINNVEITNLDDACILECDYPIIIDIKETDISDIKLGMTRDDILEKIGRPHSLYGSGFWIELYKIENSNALFYYSVNVNDEVVLEDLILCTSSDCKKLVK